MSHTARIREFLAEPQTGAQIEALSFAAIDAEAPPHSFSLDEWAIVRRVIHTTADFDLCRTMQFSAGAIASGIAALRSGAPIFVDSNMIRSGISLQRLRAVSATYGLGDIHCHVADGDVAAEARRLGLPRSILAVRKAREKLEGAVALFGNAPTALMELSRLIIEEGVRPALVVAAPVGFVHVVESKAEIMELGVPFIALTGRRGGSPIAVSILHALCGLAGSAGGQRAAGPPMEFDTIILLGHGSRVPDAGWSMQRVVEQLRASGRYRMVACCNMSRLGPHFEEVFEQCVAAGARRVLLIPYFLHEGLHMRLDIPGKMQRAVQCHPEITLVFGKHLGFDPLLVQLVEKRIAESLELPDVRQMVLPGEEEFPVPQGQCEFVPMLPEEAAKWREIHGNEKVEH